MKSVDTEHVEFIPFSRPCISELEVNEVVETLRSGWLTTGPRCKTFEKRFAEYVGTGHAVSVSSCTAGLHLALLALGIGEGDEVITSPMTFAATVNMIVHAGATPVFADIDRETRQITPDSISRCISERTRLIIPVHFAGSVCDLDGIRTLAKEHGIDVLEDSAHAVGSRYKGRKVGAGGSLCVFSFHPIKNMTTGEGGMITTDDSALAEKLTHLRFHGLAGDAWKRYAEGEVTQYDVLLPGFKYNMMDLQAALGLHQLARLDEFIDARKKLSDRYTEHFTPLNGIGLSRLPEYPVHHSWHLYTILIENPSITREAFMRELNRLGIGSGLHFKAVHLHPYYKDRFGFRYGQLPDAEYVSDRIVSLPLHPGLTHEDQDRVIAAVESLITGVRS